MTLDREILLCNTGTFVRNRTMVDQLLTWYNCTTIQYTRSSRSLHREQKVLNISCLANFSLKDLGESRICIGCGNSGVCRATGDHGYGIVKVLAPVKIVEPKKTKLRLNYPWKTVINVTVTGTVFNLSHDIGGQEVNAMTDLEPSLYEICQIEWPIPYNFTSLGSYTFTIRASNPLSKETRTVSVECNLDFVVDTASEVWNASNYVTWLEVFHAPVEEMLTYKWTSRDCNEVRIVQNVTTGKF